MAGYRIPGPLCYKQGEDIDDGTMCRTRSPQPGSFGMPMRNDYQVLTSVSDSLGCYWPAFLFSNGSKNATEFSLGEKALSLLKSVEELHLKPYDDQTGKEITAWTQGATIGYGHLIKKPEWTTYKDGFSEADANTLFEQDLSTFVAAVRANINIKLKQNEFDALVILSFNIGATGFSESSVVKLINDPKAITNYKDLKEAWMAWSKSQGKVMKGLENRRNCEWEIYSHGIYERW